jgi:hypothetical protein
MVRVVLIISLALATGCKPAVEVPPPLPELTSPIPGPPPPPPKPVFEAIELAAVDEAGQSIATIGHNVPFNARLKFKLQAGSVPVNGAILRLVAPRSDGDFICAEFFSKAQTGDDGTAVVVAPLKSYPKDGKYAVTATAGTYEVARVPLQVVEE